MEETDSPLALRRFLDSQVAEMEAQPHMDTALDETKELADELRAIPHQSGLRSQVRPCWSKQREAPIVRSSI